MRRNFAVGAILVLGGVSILFLGVLVPHFAEHKVNWQTEYETVPIGVTVLAFALLICGLGLVAVEVAAGGVVYTQRKKEEASMHAILNHQKNARFHSVE